MRALLIQVLWFTLCLPAAAQITIATESYNPSRTDANTSETVLTPTNVASGQFQKLCSWPLDDQPYAQPLYITGSPDLLIVATMNDTVYEFNADSACASAIWSVNYIPGGETAAPVLDGSIGSTHIGILGTPVYDTSTSTIYFVTMTKNTGTSALIYRLHAVGLSNGAEKFSGPVTISSATILGAQNAQRPGLALANSQIYVGWGSWGDTKPYVGHVTVHSASTLALNGTFTVATNGGSVWHPKAPAVDASGSVYFATGNGQSGDCNFGVTFGESVIRLTNASGANLGDWFTTSSCSASDSQDADIGSEGVTLFDSGNHIFTLDKDGNLRVLSTSSLGHEGAGDKQITQDLSIGNGGFIGSAAYFNGVLYAWSASDYLKAWTWNGSTFNTSPTLTGSVASINSSPRSPAVVVSANGTSNAVIWVLRPTSTSSPKPGVLEAYNTTSLAQIYSSNANASRDSSGNWIPHRQPVVDNGEVFVESGAPEIAVYGIVNPTDLSAPIDVRFTLD